MKYLLVTLTLLTASVSFSRDSSKELEIGILHPDSVVVDPTLDSTSLVFFNFPNATDQSGIIITYSIDGVQGTHSLINENKRLQLEASAGYHDLQFYYSSEYHEEYTSMNIEAGYRYYFSVYFNPSEVMIMTEKPVIYLYPETTQDIHVEVIPKGEFTFTYPKYDNGWDVTATPDGALKINDATYNYLFWEASEQLNPQDINSNIGFVVPGEDITSFLEEKLTLAGLNSKERADFITFWAPRMTTHSDVFLQFHFNKTCDRFGKLNITPEPNSIYRIYMVWQPVDELRIAPKPQEILVMDRSGFSVLEWGGQELPTNTTKEL
ncbi:MAG: hypothetical protein Crog4KO_13110 [Crocinitomicaceae bacterium]